ncbi:MAG TPA: histidine phosphatase family protein [Usitatibacter sp.]|nr:histidine phosphatase family protein [Usitatibacter sp.]
MELILWRHAEAEDPGPKGDFARDLTKKGRKQAERMAEWLRPRLEGEWRVIASPAARAIQTVTALGLDYEATPGIDPTKFADDLLREVGWPSAGNTIAVGHNPTFGEVAARLMGGAQGEVAFRKGAIWWFATRERGGRLETVLKAMMAPDMLD